MNLKKNEKKKQIQREAASEMLPHVEKIYTRGSSADAASRVKFFFSSFLQKICLFAIRSVNKLFVYLKACHFEKKYHMPGLLPQRFHAKLDFNPEIGV